MMISRRVRVGSGLVCFCVAVVLVIAASGKPAHPQLMAQATTVTKQNGGLWTVNCAQKDNAENNDCQVSQIIRVKETGKRVLMVVVKKDRRLQPNVMLALPHKIYLPAGVIVQIDTHVPREMDIETCDERACYATGVVAAAFLTFMKAGKAMHVTFQNLLHKPVTVSVPLNGFTVAYRELE